MNKERVAELRKYFMHSPETETNAVLNTTLPVIQECLVEIEKLQVVVENCGKHFRDWEGRNTSAAHIAHYLDQQNRYKEMADYFGKAAEMCEAALDE